MASVGLRQRQAVFFLLGAAPLLAQVLLLRKLLGVFAGNELTLAAVLVGWMAWTGLASALSGRAADRTADPGPPLAALLAVSALLLPLTALAVARTKLWLGSPPAEIADLPVVFLGSALVVGPFCAAQGVAFNLASRWAGAARVYRGEALGAAVAGAGFTLLLAGRTTAFQQIFLAVALLLLAAALLGHRPVARVVPAACALLAVVYAWVAPPAWSLDALYRRLRWPGQTVLAEVESRYADLAVIGREEERTFFTDGLPAFSSPLPEPAEWAAHLPLSLCVHPRRMLVLGGGGGEISRQALQHPLERLDYVQMDPALTALETRWAAGGLSDPRVRVNHQDARRFLEAEPGPWDVIVVALPPPVSAQGNRFFTLEFYRLLGRRLSPGGMVAVQAGEAANYQTPAQAELAATIRATLAAVFPRVAVRPGGGVIYLLAGGAEAPWRAEAGEVLAALEQRGVVTKWVRDYYLNAEWSAERLDSLARSLDRVESPVLNRDLAPRVYWLGLMGWAEQAGQGGRRLLAAMRAVGPGHILGGTAALFLLGLALCRRRPDRAALASAGALGFAVMSLELAALLAFQSLYGVVYHLLGMMVAAVMAGLALGARLGESRGGTGGLVRADLALAAAGAGVWAAVEVAARLALPLGGAAALFSAALFTLALAGGAVFVRAAAVLAANGKAAGRTAGWVNGSDHVGGALGALLTGTFLAPVLGLRGTLAMGVFPGLLALGWTVIAGERER